MNMDVDFSNESTMASLRSVIKWEIQHLLSRLSGIGEETLVLSVSVMDGTLTELGSNVGIGFLSINDCNQLKKEFLAYCRGFHYKPDETLNDMHIDGTAYSPEPVIQNNFQSVKRKRWKRNKYLQPSKLSRLCMNGRNDTSKHDAGPLIDGCSNGLGQERCTTEYPRIAQSRRKKTPRRLLICDSHSVTTFSNQPENCLEDDEHGEGDIHLDELEDEKYIHEINEASLKQGIEDSVQVPESVTDLVDNPVTESTVLCKNENLNTEHMDYDETHAKIPQLLPDSTETKNSTSEMQNNFSNSDTDTSNNFSSTDAKTNFSSSNSKNNFLSSDTKNNFSTSDTKNYFSTSDTKTIFSPSDTSCQLDQQSDTVLNSSVSSKFDSVSMVQVTDKFPVFHELRQNKRTISYNEEIFDEEAVMSPLVDDSQSKCTYMKNSNTTKSQPGSKKLKEQNCDINASKKKSLKLVDENSGESVLLDACKMLCGRYQCPLCQQKTRDRHDLKRHLRTHTKEKPYQCKICDRKFTRKWDLENHISRHLDKDANCSVPTSTTTKNNSSSFKKSNVCDLSYNKLINELLIKMNIADKVDQNGSIGVDFEEHVGRNLADKSLSLVGNDVESEYVGGNLADKSLSSSTSGNDGESEMSNSCDSIVPSNKTVVKTEHCSDLENRCDQPVTSDIKDQVLDDR